MKYLVNQEEMRKIDLGSIMESGIPSILLMERASLCVSEAVMEELGDKKGPILIVSGVGNNGADGLAVARILGMKGYETYAFSLGKEEKATEEWKLQSLMLENLGVSHTKTYEEAEKELDALLMALKPAMIVDAIFGIGLTRAVSGIYARVIEEINQWDAPVVSVDMPSGINTDNGHVEGIAVRADRTITFGKAKLGQILYPGAEYCGRLSVCEVGFDRRKFEEAGHSAFTYEKEDLNKLIPKRKKNVHKTSFGILLCVAGSPGMAGAAAFSVKSAYRTGCGYVKAYTPSKNVGAMLSLVPEAVLKSYPHDKFKKEEKDAFKKEIQSAKALLIGPGLGSSKTATELVKISLAEKDPSQGLLIDADGLRILAREGISALPPKCVVTPHMGEMSALTGLSVKELLADPVKAAKEYALKTGAVCLLKGARTVISDGMRVYINTSGCQAMATAGSGDVLSGIIGALLAEGMEVFEAACLGAFVHGLCGEICAQKYGNRPVMAGDLTEALCDVLKNY